MVSISPELKNAFNPNQGEGGRFIDWSVTFEVIQDDAYAAVVPSASSERIDISRIAQAVNRNAEPISPATYEQGGFPLDGSVVIPPRAEEESDLEVGLYMGELSDENGFFARQQTFSAQFDRQYNLIALSLTWGAAPPLDYTVRWYGNGVLLQEEIITDNQSSANLISRAVKDVDLVTLNISRALPRHFVRLAEFTPGASVVYTGHNSTSLEISEELDLLSERIPSGTFRLSTDNIARAFNIFEPDGIYAYFRDRMRLRTKIGAMTAAGRYEYVRMADHYLKAPKLKGNLHTVELEGGNLLSVLSDTSYTKGKYRTGTLASFADEVAADAGVIVSYPDSFRSITLTAYVASMPHTQAFRMLAQAGTALLHISRDDVIVFAPIGETVLQTFTPSDYRMDSGLSPSDTDIYNTVRMTYYALSAATSASELARIAVSGTLVSAEFYADNCRVVTSAGEYLVSYDPSTAQSAVITSGALVVTGKLVIANEAMKEATTRQIGEAALVYQGSENIMVQAANVDAVTQFLLTHVTQKRRTVKMEYRGYPYLEVGDLIAFNTGSSDTQPFVLCKNALRLSGGMTGTLEAREA